MYQRFWLIIAILLSSPLAWAAPDTTLTIAPAATSGGRILSADENDRNSDISTWANSHDHNDIDQLVINTVNLGDGSAGNKTLCANAADSSDSCLRWNDSADRWTISTDGSTFNQLLVSTGTTSITPGGIAFGDGGHRLDFTSVLTNGQLLIGDGSGAPTAATLTAGAGIDTTTGAGSITVAWDGDEVGSGSDPSLSSCGTSPSITGNDLAGRVVVGTTETFACTVTFNTAFGTTPMCTVVSESSFAAFRVAPTASALVITADRNIASQFLTYHCFGQD